MRAVFLTLLTLLFFSSCAQQPQPPGNLDGTWTTKRNDTLRIYKAGKDKDSYIVSIPSEGQYLSCRLNATHDTLWNKTNDSKHYFVVGERNKYIHDAKGMARYNAYFMRSGNSGADMRDVKVSRENFFDLSTTHYCAGQRYDLTPRAGILFSLNREFIRKHHLDSVEIERYGGKKYTDGEHIEKTFHYIFHFDKYGNVIKLRVQIMDEERPILWQYTYADARRGILKSISLPGGAMSFDEDNWPVDKFGQKEIQKPFLHWTYFNDTGLPRKAVVEGGNGQQFTEFQYNASRQLVRATYRDKTAPRLAGFHTEFVYDKRGVPVKITEVIEYNVMKKDD